MIKVMIVEDEAPIQRSIKLAVASSHERFEVIATAFNGHEALQLIHQSQPDLIITDIRMPIMDGLALTEKVRELYPQIQIILLSGFPDFDYARKAMLLGVTHYLLKPISRLHLKELFDAMYLEILGYRRSLLRQYVTSLIHGKSFSEFSLAQQNLYGSHLLILCCAGAIPTTSFEDDIPGKVYWEKNDLHSILLEEMNGHGEFTIVSGKSVSEQVIMLSFFKSQEIVRSPREWVDAMADRMGSELPVSIGFSWLYSDLLNTVSVAKVIRSMLYTHIVFAVSIRLSISDRLEHSTSNLELDSLLERKLVVALEQKNIKLFKLEISNLFDKWKHMQLSQFYVEKNLRRIIELVYSMTGPTSYYTISILEIDVNRIIIKSADYEDVFRYICGIIDHFFLLQDTVKDDEKHDERLAERIAEYLREHFAEQLNHQILSEKFGIVPSQLSKVFTKYKGTSPIKYIVQLRVEKAKEMLLEQPSRLAKNIAEIVGYSDPYYFSRIFKRETGLYPSEFRDQNGITSSN